ncbi:MAG: hypothetical protein R2880_04215 [Deinococcales bacterium]
MKILTGSVVNNAIAQIILEEELDVDVEIIVIDQYSMWRLVVWVKSALV